MAVLVDRPRQDSRNPLAGLVSQTVVLIGRLLVRSVRNPMTVVHAVLLPVAFLITLKVVFGDSITAITGFAPGQSRGASAARSAGGCSRS